MIELLIVVALIAVAAGVVTLSVRDPAANQLDHEGMRLATLLEAARAESRGMAVPVRFALGPGSGGPSDAAFRFEGMPLSTPLATRWLDPEVQAEIIGAKQLTLGPEPLIGAQRIVLRLHGRSLTLATDGLSPFAPLDDALAASSPTP